MDFALQPHLYRHVPVIFWPWLFWQLWRIALWGELTGRDVMVAVDTKGRVHIRLVADDPSRWTPQVLPHAHQYNLTSRLPDETRGQWRMRLEAVYAPGFGVQDWIFWPKALGAVVAQFCQPERPTIRDPVGVRSSEVWVLRRAEALRASVAKQVTRSSFASAMDRAQGCACIRSVRFLWQTALSPVHVSEAIRNLLRPT